MGIQNWSEDIILVDLPAEPQIGEELKAVTEIVRDRGDCDVVLDFSSVDIVTSSSLSKLLKLRKLLVDCGHRFVFCGVAACVFVFAGIYNFTVSLKVLIFPKIWLLEYIAALVKEAA